MTGFIDAYPFTFYTFCILEIVCFALFVQSVIDYPNSDLGEHIFMLFGPSLGNFVLCLVIFVIEGMIRGISPA